MRCHGLIIPFLALSVALAGCGEKKPSAPQIPEIRFALKSPVKTLDPARVQDQESRNVAAQIYEGLMEFVPPTDPERLKVKNCLIDKEWTISPDGLTYTFHLIAGVIFHDGSPLDSEAVRFSFERILQPDHPSAVDLSNPDLNYIRSLIRSVEALDPHTVRFQLAAPNASFLKILATLPCSIVSPDAVRAHGEEFGRNPAGTGPYRLARWEESGEVALEADLNYGRGNYENEILPYVDRVTFFPVNEAQVALLEPGDANLVEVDRWDPSLDRAGLVPARETGANLHYLALNTRRAPFDNPTVREAVSWAIQRTPILEHPMVRGAAIPARGLYPPNVWGFDATHAPYQGSDPDRARTLVAEAGISPATPVSLLVLEDPLEWREGLHAMMSARIAEDLAAIGLTALPEIVDATQYRERIHQGDVQMALAGWRSSTGDALGFLELATGLNGMAPLFLPSEVRSLLGTAYRATQSEERYRVHSFLEQVISRHIPLVYICHSDELLAVRKNVENGQPHPTGFPQLESVRLDRRD